MICSKCGAQLPEETKFCSECGTSLGDDSVSSPTAPEASTSAPASTAVPQPQQKRPVALIAIAGVLAVVLVGVVIGIFATLGSSSGSGAQATLPEATDTQAGTSGSTSAQVKADIRTNNDNGKFGPTQYYNGTLYVGQLHYPGTQIEMSDTTPFFGNTDYFHFANNKAYWIDEHHANDGGHVVSFYSADIDGSNQQTLAEDVAYPADLYAVGDYIFFSSRAYVGASSSLAYINTATGERGGLPENIYATRGVCNSRLVVVLESATGDTMLGTLAFFDPATQELTDIPSSEFNIGRSKIEVSDTGIFITNSMAGTTSFFSSDGSSVWLDKDSPELGEALKPYFSSALMDTNSYYWVDETNKDTHAFEVGVIDLSSGEQKSIPFDAAEVAALNSSAPGFSYQSPLVKDGNSVIVAIDRGEYASTEGQSCFLYKVSLEDGTAECLNQWVG